MTVISILLLIVFGLSIIHFVYEGIILPSIRWKLRFDLFKLRDDLRFLKIEDASLQDREFACLHESLGVSLTCLKFYDVFSFIECHRIFKQNKKLAEEAQKRAMIIKNSNSERVKEIHHKQAMITLKAFLFNNLILIIWLSIIIIPVLMILFFWDKITKYFDYLKNLINQIICVPESKLSQTGLLAY